MHVDPLLRRTDRLDIRPLPAEVAAALRADRETAANMLGARLSSSWPLADLLDVLPWQASAAHDEERYGVWVMIERATNSIVGDIGFIGPPRDGAIEIGFSVVPERRRRGYATEAAEALVEWALLQPDIARVVARCAPDNQGSVAVLDRAGFERTSEADGLIQWQATSASVRPRVGT